MDTARTIPLHRDGKKKEVITIVLDPNDVYPVIRKFADRNNNTFTASYWMYNPGDPRPLTEAETGGSMFIRTNNVNLTETGVIEFVNLDGKGDVAAVAAFVASAMTLLSGLDEDVLVFSYDNFQPAPNLRHMDFVLLLTPNDQSPRS